MRLGDELRKARLARKLTASQVAAATRMKVQVVEAIEREDFSGIAAPIYSKGFIRLYAEYVGVDSRPLIDDFVNRVLAPHPAEDTQETSVVEPGSAGRVAPAVPKAEAEEKVVVTRRAPPQAQKQEAAAPAEEPVPQLDLFAQTARRKPEAEPEPLPRAQEPVAAPEPETEEESAETTPAVRWKEHRLAEAWKRIVGRVVDGFASAGHGLLVVLLAAFRKIRFRSASSPAPVVGGEIGTVQRRRIAAPTGFLPWLSIIIGVVIVLLFAVSVAYQYAHRGAKPVPPESTGIMETFRPVVEPPPPYVD